MKQTTEELKAVTTWQQGKFIRSRENAHWSSDRIASCDYHESHLVRPYPKGNAICRVNNPNNAVWIAEQLNLAQTVEAKDKRIAELEKKESRFDQYALESEVMRKVLLCKDRSSDDVSPKDLKGALKQRDLEQQAKGICDFYNDYFHNAFTTPILVIIKNDLQARFKELRKQAKELNDEF